VALLEGVVDDPFVLLDGDGASRIDDDATRLGIGIDAVNRGQEELLLEVSELLYILSITADLHESRITATTERSQMK